MVRWVQIQTDNVPHLVDQQRIAGKLEAFRTMRLQPKGPPNAADGGLAEAGSSSQHAAGPVSRSLRRLLQSQPHYVLDLLVADLARRSRTRFVSQSCQAFGDEAIAPQTHRETCGAQLGGGRGVA